MPGLQVQSLVGHVQEATDQSFSLTLMFLSLSLPLSLSLKSINIFLAEDKNIKFIKF